MRYFSRELRRLWGLEVYDGDPDDPDVTTHTERCIAWNAQDAIRRCGKRVAVMPESLGFVTWDDEPLIILNTHGPTDQVAAPTIALDDDWDF